MTNTPARLATVQRVTDIIPVEGKEPVELAKVLGYLVAVEKDSVRIGNLVAFHMVDSCLPVDAEHGQYASPAKEAKASKDADGARFRVRTRKVGEAYSQGFIVPLAKLTGVAGLAKVGEGDDLTALLNVTRYEPKVAASKSRPATPTPWPTELFDGISDEPEQRLQSSPDILKEMHGLAVAVMMKCDGQAITVAKDLDGSVVVCSRGDVTEIVDEAIVSKLPPGYAIQGEVCGPGIRSNRMGLASKQVFVARVFRRQVEGDTWQELGLNAARGFCADRGIDRVPLIQRGWVLDVASGRHTVASFIELSKQLYGNDFPAQGIIVRAEGGQRSRNGGPLSFEVVSPEFELRV